MNKLRFFRQLLAGLFFLGITLLFLDFTGTIHGWLGWMAKVQLIPAILALHFGVIILLVLLTAIFGRLYCSIICPLGIFQDLVSRSASFFNKKRKFSYSPAKNVLRYTTLALFIAAMVGGLSSFVALLDPYSIWGRAISNLLSPIYKLVNNFLAYIAERVDSYSFYNTEIIVWSGSVFAVALLSIAIVKLLAWRGGRTYCNTICPVGTLLGVVSKWSLFKIVVDQTKCNGCKKCVRTCKASCIESDSRLVDYSRCVSCFNCIDSCSQGAVSYQFRGAKGAEAKTEKVADIQAEVDNSKRTMLTVSAALLASTALKGQEKMVDGGLAIIEDKKIPNRQTALVPFGAESLRNFTSKCTGCQLCVSVCPNQVLRPSTSLINFMQPHMSFELGYCRPECTACSEVCPAGAITKIDKSEKSSIQIGHAIWIEKNCVVLTDKVSCGNCAVHCPVGAIQMVEASDKERYGMRKIPVVNVERCIGCGACENLCPARPFSAIYVEGHSMHKTV